MLRSCQESFPFFNWVFYVVNVVYFLKMIYIMGTYESILKIKIKTKYGNLSWFQKHVLEFQSFLIIP